MVQLTKDTIKKIMNGDNVEKPILQVLGHKKIAGNASGGADRYRLLLSDGEYSHSSAMLATQLNEKIISGELDTFCVIKLEKFLCNTIQPDRKVLILLDIEIVASSNVVGEKIGNPVAYKVGESNNNAAKPAEQTNGNGAVQNNQGGGFTKPPTNLSGGAKPGATPNTPGGTPGRVHPISSLTPYQNRWTIRVRVTSKSTIRTWSNSRGEGKLFSMTLLDDSGEIKATAFRDEVDKFYDMIEVNKVYYLSKANLKTADKRYSNTNNDYEMMFNSETHIQICEDDVDLPQVTYNFININNLDSQQANTIVDVIGVVKNADDITKVTGKQSNREITKRDVQLVDESCVQVRMTLWGNDAEKFDATGNPVMAVKGCRLSDWGGRSLSVLASSQMLLNPDIPEAHRLRGWYDSVGHTADYEEFRNEGGNSGGAGSYSTNWKTFGQVKAENLGQDKPEYFHVKGTAVKLKKENCMYMACPTEQCNKKVVDQSNGLYRCEKCAKEYPNYKWRLILSTNIADHTDNAWVTCFQETAELILGKPADELGRLRETSENEFDQVFEDANFSSYIFKMRAKMETYMDETRLKTICVEAKPVNYKEYSNRLIEEINAMSTR